MTYLQLMIKCLSFFKNEKDKFDINSYYSHWLGETYDDIDLYYKSQAKKAIMYLTLLETKNYGNTNNYLLNLLEKELSSVGVDLCKTLETTKEKTIKSIIEDPYMFDQICLLGQESLTEEEQNKIINELLNEFQEQKPEECQVQQYESAIHNIMEMVSTIIPELFFTEKGYKYIDKEYQIDDTNLRERCYEYLKANIQYYNSERIYKVDENIYSELYEVEEACEFEDSYDESDSDDYEEDYLDDYDESDFDDYEEDYLDGYDEDEIRGQVDIYGEDIDNYDILYYSITLLIVILRFIKNKQYDKIEKLIELDEEMTNFHSGHGFYFDKTLIESLYQPKTMGKDYHKEISTPSKSDSYLDFFLSNNDFTQQYTVQQLALIISHCFDMLDNEPINKIYKNNTIINDILATTNTDNQEKYVDIIKNNEEKIKQLVKIKKGNREN